MIHNIDAKGTKCPIESALIEVQLVRPLTSTAAGKHLGESAQHLFPHFTGTGFRLYDRRLEDRLTATEQDR